MARKFKRPAIWAVAVAAYDVWRRLPAKQRQQALGLARKHGPKVAKTIIKARRAAKK
jgi:hypothetical protein